MPNEQVPNWLRGHQWLAEPGQIIADAAQRAVPAKDPDYNPKRGEELFRLILSGIKEIYDVDATIAGGAVRDLAAGVTDHKDVDIFIPFDPEAFMFQSVELGWGELHRVKKGMYSKNNNPAFDGSTGRAGGYVQDMNIDIVFLKEPLSKEFVDSFPIFAQRGIFSLEHGMQLSPEALSDNINKTFTIDPTITDKNHLRGLLAKVEEWRKRPEYKEWKVVEPDIPEWWEAKKEDEARIKEKEAMIVKYTNKISATDFLAEYKDEWAKVFR